ncbi:Phage tail tube protein [Pedobacter sp. ok626]|uniref:phage tail tube protein n=1 Tax=Pedobacter sp. ok626 TaxID=1761882 RepID=UPI0008862DC2|nr:phage tail tube protein [Pedobacter sp. ok626]SDJ96242.1 Phage tail tube protein [Pedobacter sp. ok626]
MQRNILTGSEFLLYNIDNEPVAYSKNCAIKINNSLTDVTTKSSDSWSEYMVGLKDWSIEFEGLVSYGDDFNTSFFVNKFQNSEPFFIRFGVIQDNFTHAFFGEVHIESIDQNADNGELVSYSGSFKGIGNLSFTDEGTPEQSGYIKTETDPVFRGSAAYNISDADKVKWHAAHDKIVKEINFFTVGDITTLKLKFQDGIEYTSSFKNVTGTVDLSGYYTKGQTDTMLAVTQVDIDNANTLLSNIANDNKLTPNEKVNVLKEWQIIMDEKPVLVQQAVTYGLETIDYDVSFNSLELYLEPLLLSMLTTSNIEGFELRNYFRAYYDQKVLLLKKVSEASKHYTDDSIDKINIGGRNYHLNGDQVFTISQSVNQLIQSGNYPINSQLALSFYAKSIEGINRLNLEFDGQTGKEFFITNAWTRYTCILNTGDIPTLFGRLKVVNRFPYKFPASFGSGTSNSVEVKDMMVTLGNKPMDFVHAPADFFAIINQAKLDAQAAAKSYTDAQDLFNQSLIEALVDGKIDDIEQINLDLLESNLQAAKDYSDVVSLNAKVLANAYADGLITDFEQQIIDASNANILAAKQYTDTQRALSEIVTKSYADGIVDATETALINNANNNLAAAKAYSDAQDLYTKTLSDAYADGKVSIEEQARINAIQASLDAAKGYTDTQRVLSETVTKAYADGIVDDVEAVLIQNSQDNLAAAKQYSDAQDLLTKTLSNAYADGKISTEEQNRINAVQTSLDAAKAYTEAQRELSETVIKAYTDGVIDDEEARAIADAQAKLIAAKAYSDQKLLEAKTEITDYVDVSILDKANEIIANTTGQINVANTATLQAANSEAETKANAAKDAAIASANSYTAAQKVLVEVTAAAYADGKVTAEEQARLTQAANNLQAAYDDSTNKSNAAAQYGIAAQNLHNALVSNLKSLAYSDIVEVSKLGSTVIENGVIKTNLLSADYIKSSIINSTYVNTLSLDASVITSGLISADRIDVTNLVATNIAATTGTIGPLNIGSSNLWLGNANTWTANESVVSLNADYHLFRENGSISGQVREVAFNLNSALAGENYTAYKIENSIQNNSPSPTFWKNTNYGVIVDVANADINTGVWVKNGDVGIDNGNLNVVKDVIVSGKTNLASVSCRQMSTKYKLVDLSNSFGADYTLSSSDYFLIINASSTGTFAKKILVNYLNVIDGQIFKIINDTSNSVVIERAGGATTVNFRKGGAYSTTYTLTAGSTVDFLYNENMRVYYFI